MPIPKVTEIGKALGGYFAISERAFGPMLDELEEIDMKRIIPSFLQTLDEMRQADLGTSIGYGRWEVDEDAPYKSWRDFLLDVKNDSPEKKVHGWRASLAGLPMGEAPFNRASEYLKSLVHDIPENRHLVHTDLLYSNVLTSSDRISAVIDWGNSIYGDFLYDLANFTFCSPWYPSTGNIDWKEEARRHYQEIKLEMPKFEERLRVCEVHIGLEMMAWNIFKKRWDELEVTTKRVLSLIE